MSSFANIALSNRLTEDPMRFFKSGYQTSTDIIKLLSCIRNGEHEVIPQTANFNLFAYSIGAFLAEIILMGNPENLFSESKLFMFLRRIGFQQYARLFKINNGQPGFPQGLYILPYDFENTLNRKKPS